MALTSEPVNGQPAASVPHPAENPSRVQVEPVAPVYLYRVYSRLRDARLWVLADASARIVTGRPDDALATVFDVWRESYGALAPASVVAVAGVLSPSDVVADLVSRIRKDQP